MASYGYGPYEEAALAGQARLNWRQRALGALQGLAFVRPGATPAEAFTQGLGGAARGISQAQMAAQEYAERQVAAEERRRKDEIWRLSIESAAKDKPEKPTPTPKPEPKTIDNMTPEEWKQRIQREAELAKAKAAGRPTPKGGVVKAPAAPKPAASKPSTGSEKQTLSYYNRMKTAEETIQALEGKMANMPLPQQYQMRYAPNQFQSSDQQKYRQAQRAFTEARLRKESGAAIPQGEYDTDAQTYFAQPGDSPEVRAQKRAARKSVLDGLKFSSGRAYEEFYGETGGNSGGATLRYNPKTGELEPIR